MNSSDTPEAVFCSKCGRPSPASALSCDGCGKDLTEDRTVRDTIPFPPLPSSSPSQSVDAGPVVLATAASTETLRRLRTQLDELAARGFARFPGDLLWPDEGGGELLQAIPPGMISLARLVEEPPARHGWQLALITELAQAVDNLHRAGGLFRSLKPEAVLLDRETLALAGFCVPLGLGRLGEVDEESSREGLEPPFASPEALGEIDAPVGPQADVYLVAVLASTLLTGARPNDPVSAGPAVSAVLEDAVAVLPALRPATASNFVRELRRALIRDIATGGWDFQAAGFSDIGLGGRSNNEDAWGGWVRADAGLGTAGSLALFLVADGMGGEARGELASRIAARLVTAELMRQFAVPSIALPALAVTTDEADLALQRPEDSAITQGLARAATVANYQVRELARQLGQATGTTLTAIAICGTHAALAHLGDSRAYLLRGGLLHKLTEDHSVLARLQAIDHPLLSDPNVFVPRSMLYRSLGQEDEAHVDMIEFRLAEGDRFLICSDGLWDEIDQETLEQTFVTAADPLECARQLVGHANAAGGHDNSTAVVVFVRAVALNEPAADRTRDAQESTAGDSFAE